nr:unnamed protein product [Callosobruchus analis]
MTKADSLRKISTEWWKKLKAKNKLEAYIFQLKQAAQDCGDKLSSDDKALSLSRVNNLAEKEKFEDKEKALTTRICSPIMAKPYGGGQNNNQCDGSMPGAGGMPGGSCGQQAGFFGGHGQ